MITEQEKSVGIKFNLFTLIPNQSFQDEGQSRAMWSPLAPVLVTPSITAPESGLKDHHHLHVPPRDTSGTRAEGGAGGKGVMAA